MMNREQKILVIVTDYPDKVGNVKLQYIHTRNVAYLKFGLTVTVCLLYTSDAADE